MKDQEFERQKYFVRTLEDVTYVMKTEGTIFIFEWMFVLYGSFKIQEPRFRKVQRNTSIHCLLTPAKVYCSQSAKPSGQIFSNQTLEKKLKNYRKLKKSVEFDKKGANWNIIFELT